MDAAVRSEPCPSALRCCPVDHKLSPCAPTHTLMKILGLSSRYTPGVPPFLLTRLNPGESAVDILLRFQLNQQTLSFIC